MWTIFSWGVATTLWLLISIMRWPTLTPPRSAMPPRIRLQICDGNTSSQTRLPRFYTWEQNATHNPILDAKAQLVAQVRSSDEDRGHGGASDDVQLDAGLVLQSLHEDSKWNRWEAEAWSPAFCDYGFNSSECSSWVWWKFSHHVLWGHLQIHLIISCINITPTNCELTLMMLWQVDSGNPTKLVPLIDMIWSPMFNLPERSAGPACIMLAMMTVGKIEPHPLSTMTTPRISPLAFSIKTWKQSSHGNGN